MRARVAIEIDGPMHERQRETDANRDAAFMQLGWRELSFTPKQLADGPAFLAAVRAACSPSPRGEGAGGGVSYGDTSKHAMRGASGNAKRQNDGDPPAPRPPPLTGREGVRRMGASRVLPPRRKT